MKRKHCTPPPAGKGNGGGGVWAGAGCNKTEAEAVDRRRSRDVVTQNSKILKNVRKNVFINLSTLNRLNIEGKLIFCFKI